MNRSEKDKETGFEESVGSVWDLTARLQYDLSPEGIREKYEKEAEKIIQQNPDLMKNPNLKQNITHLLELMGYDRIMMTILKRNLETRYNLKRGSCTDDSSVSDDFFKKINLPKRDDPNSDYYLSEQVLKDIIIAILGSTDEYIIYQDHKDILERENESSSCVFFDSGNQMGYEIVSWENYKQRVRRTARIKREENGDYTISEERTIIQKCMLQNDFTLPCEKELPLSKTEARFNGVGLNTSVKYSEVIYDDDCNEIGGLDYKIVRDPNNPFVVETERNERGCVQTSYKSKAKRLLQPNYIGTDQLMRYSLLLNKRNSISYDIDASMFDDDDMTITDDDQVSRFLRQNSGPIKKHLDPSKHCGIVYGIEEFTRQYLLTCYDKLIQNISAEAALSNALFSGTAMSDLQEASNPSLKLQNAEQSDEITQ